MNNNKIQQTTGRPKGIGKELNQPNYTLMAKAFINLYKEFGAVTK